MTELISQFGEATQRLAISRNPHSYRLEEIKDFTEVQELELPKRSWNSLKKKKKSWNGDKLFFFS